MLILLYFIIFYSFVFADENGTSNSDQPIKGTNTVDGEPEVTCDTDAIYVGLYTKHFFEGRVFVRGWHEDKNCHALTTWFNHVSILVPHLDCGARRTRSLNPPGVKISVVLIVSFHPHLMTDLDRAYDISCFHIQNVNHTTDLLTSASSQFVPLAMPTCKYEVFRGMPQRTLARYVSIGDQIFHRWMCSVENSVSDNYCMIVKACFVADIQGRNRHYLLDQNGCSLDERLMPQLTYINNMQVGQMLKAFSFADKPQIYFQCQIDVMVKLNHDKPCPTPQCDKNNRVERSVAAWSREHSSLVLDASSQQLNVLEFSDSRQVQCPDYGDPLDVEIRSVHSRVCVSTAAFVIVVSSTFLVAICTLIVITVALYKRTIDLFVDHS